MVRRADEFSRRACQKLGRYFDLGQLRAITGALKRLREIIDVRANVRQLDVNPRTGLAGLEVVD